MFYPKREGALQIAALGFIVFSFLEAKAQTADLRAAEQSLASGDVTGAQVALARAIRTSPETPVAFNLQGAIYAQQGNLEAAEQQFKAAIQKDPGFKPALMNLGRIYQLRAGEPGYLDRGISTYEKVLQLDPRSAEAHHQLALLLHWRGSFSASLAHLNKLPVSDQERRAAMALRCADFAGLGDKRGAEAAAAKLLADPELTEADVLSALPAIEAHDKPTAVRLLAGLESRNLASRSTLEKLSALAEESGEFPSARGAFERLFAADPSKPAPLLALARVAWKQKDYTATMSYLAHARDLEPNDPRTHFLFGLAANEMHAAQDARRSLLKAVELDPDNAYFHYALGVLQLQWKEKDAAVPHLRRYVEAHPEDPRGRLALGYAYFSLFQDGDAKRELEPLTRIPAVGQGAELLLGRLASRADSFPAAVAHYRRLLELNPRSVEGRAELASLYSRSGDYAHGRIEAEAALKLDPANYLANHALLRMYLAAKDPRAAEQAQRVQKIADKQGSDSLGSLQRSIEVRPY